MLLPFFPRNPHLLVAMSLEPSASGSDADLRSRRPFGPGGPSWMTLGLPPRMAETDECGDRACFWTAEVIAMHSDITRDTGSTATDTGRLRYCMREESNMLRRGVTVPGAIATAGSMAVVGWTSRLILQQTGQSYDADAICKVRWVSFVLVCCLGGG
jgi:hypothetical protein